MSQDTTEKPTRLNRYTYEIPTHGAHGAPTFQLSVVAATRTQANQLLPEMLEQLRLASPDGKLTADLSASEGMLERLELVNEAPVGTFTTAAGPQSCPEMLQIVTNEMHGVLQPDGGTEPIHCPSRIGEIKAEFAPIVLAALTGPPGDLHRCVIVAAGDVFYQPWAYNINSHDGDEWTYEKQQAYMDEIGRNIVRAALKFLYGDVLPTEDEMVVEEFEPGQKQLKCAKCGVTGCENFRYVEDISSERKVIGFNDDGVLEIEGYYKTEGWDEDAKNIRLWCRNCGAELDLGDQALEFI